MRWSKEQHGISGEELRTDLTLEVVYTFSTFLICTLQLANIVIWFMMTSETQAREVATKWILTVAGVNPLVRIFRRAFGVEVAC